LESNVFVYAIVILRRDIIASLTRHCFTLYFCFGLKDFYETTRFYIN
jgi:hypothetical protein